jgi:hypothetical protein
MMMIILYVVSSLSHSHRADAKRTTRLDDVIEVAAYSEVSRKTGNVICGVPHLPVSSDCTTRLPRSDKYLCDPQCLLLME